MRYRFDLRQLSSLINKKRGRRSLREVSNEIGISQSTLSRIVRKRHVPDMQTFTQICNWLDVSPSTFFKGDEASNSLSAPEAIAFQLQSDENLDPATANVLAVLVKAAYHEFS